MTDTASDPTIDPSEREFGPSGISLSTYRFPTGWFIVGFASELAPGQVKRAHYFGEELVIFRTASGQINVLDAYCQHLGANMGVGGTVEGEQIVCPVARLALERRRHQCPDPVQQDRLQAERPHQDLPGRGVVRLHPGVARTPRPRTLLAAAGAARAGNR